jgi:hypothetical protein
MVSPDLDLNKVVRTDTTPVRVNKDGKGQPKTDEIGQAEHANR